MEKVQYTEVPQSESKSMPPPYLPVGDEESMIGDAPSDGCTPGRMCLASVMSFLFCFWPAALVGMVYSVKARCSDSYRAHAYMRIAKRCLWLSFLVGAVIITVATVVHLVMVAHIVKGAYKGAVKGYVAGTYEGETKGAQDAKALIENAQAAKFPEQIPGQVNVFDINSPFWADVWEEIDDPKDAARVVGFSFGWVDGYKKGFCGTENADCNGVNMKAVVDYVQCEHMLKKMDKIKAKYLSKLQGGEEEDEHEHKKDKEHKKGKDHKKDKDHKKEEKHEEEEVKDEQPKEVEEEPAQVQDEVPEKVEE